VCVCVDTEVGRRHRGIKRSGQGTRGDDEAHARTHQVAFESAVLRAIGKRYNAKSGAVLAMSVMP